MKGDPQISHRALNPAETAGADDCGGSQAPAELRKSSSMRSAISAAFRASDRNVALGIDEGKLDPRTALAVMAEVRAWLTCLGGGLGDLLKHDRTEEAAARKGGA